VLTFPGSTHLRSCAWLLSHALCRGKSPFPVTANAYPCAQTTCPDIAAGAVVVPGTKTMNGQVLS
jgi:hypothetical protein